MKVSRKQLRKIISESMYDPKHGIKRLEEPYKSKIMSVLDNPDVSPEDQKQFHHLADTIGDYKDPRPNMPDDSLVGVHAQQADYLKYADQEIETYLPGFFNLPKDIIDAVVEFVFLAKGNTLHIQLEEDTLEEEIGLDMYYRATAYPDRNLPENADAVKIVDSYRNNPKAHDPKFYSIYAAHSIYKGVDPFSKIDPYLNPNSQYSVHRTGDAQAGFHDGFREEYQKVTTKKAHNISSYAVEESFIEMMRDLRPDCEEEVIN